MRLIADAASKRETLTDAAAQGMACFIAEETLARVDVSLSAGESDAQTAAELLHLPDETLSRLEEDETLSDILADVQTRARRAVSAHPENTLYTQLAQSLVNWCALMEETPTGHASLCAGDDGAALPGIAAGTGESVSFKYGFRAAHARPLRRK